MRTIIFDIETSSYPFESLSESQQEYLLRYAEKEKDDQTKNEKVDEAIRYTSLYPFTAKVIAIGIYDLEKEKSYVYYESIEKDEWQNEEKNIYYKGVTEEEMISSFWRIVDSVDRVVTFNGRGFDVPFMNLRSAMLKIKPSKNLMTNRFDKKLHIDLLDQLTYFGIIRKFNLDFYCHSFGIASPKAHGISGMDVKNLYEAGRIKDIAIYCGEDILATANLYNIWKEFLEF